VLAIRSLGGVSKGCGAGSFYRTLWHCEGAGQFECRLTTLGGLSLEVPAGGCPAAHQRTGFGGSSAPIVRKQCSVPGRFIIPPFGHCDCPFSDVFSDISFANRDDTRTKKESESLDFREARIRRLGLKATLVVVG
jgi:hypothetical protein